MLSIYFFNFLIFGGGDEEAWDKDEKGKVI